VEGTHLITTARTSEYGVICCDIIVTLSSVETSTF